MGLKCSGKQRGRKKQETVGNGEKLYWKKNLKEKKKKDEGEEEEEDLYRYITLKTCVFAQAEIQLLPSGQTEMKMGIRVQNLMNCTANDVPTASS
jgi:hypothetical protein